jgi:hypothetical protein
VALPAYNSKREFKRTLGLSDDASFYLATVPRPSARVASLSTICAAAGAIRGRGLVDTSASGAAVSMLLAWDELNADIGPAYFKIENAPRRLDALSKNPWDGFFAAARPLTARKR